MTKPQAVSPIRLKLVDTWADDTVEQNGIVRMLRENYEVELVDKDPTLLLFSCFSEKHTQYTSFNCVKLFFTGENTPPDFTQCDYAMGFDEIAFEDRYLRMPLFAHHGQLENVKNREPVTQADIEKRERFCNFIYSNRYAAPLREQIYRQLTEYKHVESAGKYLRNIMVDEDANITLGRGQPNTFKKLAVQQQYRFSIAFENSEHEGYTTEKIMDAFAARTIPIYWGNPHVLRDFDPRSFINAYDFDTIEDLVAEVIRIDNDPEAYLEMLNAPVFTKSFLALPPLGEQMSAFIARIVEQEPAVARKRAKSGAARRMELQTARKYATLWDKLKKRLPSKPVSYENTVGYSIIKPRKR